MRVAILDGEPIAGTAFDLYVRDFARLLAAAGHCVDLISLRELRLKGCSGCFSCWLKTPGECAKRDDSATVCRAVMASELTVVASPIIMGFTSALLKRATDQMIPLIHPYFVVEQGEMHHRARYGKYPVFGLLTCASDDTDAEDIAITEQIWSRTALDLKSRLVFCKDTSGSPAEVINELTAIA